MKRIRRRKRTGRSTRPLNIPFKFSDDMCGYKDVTTGHYTSPEIRSAFRKPSRVAHRTLGSEDVDQSQHDDVPRSTTLLCTRLPSLEIRQYDF